MSNPIHGEWQLCMVGSVMHLTLTGAFNRDGVASLHDEAAALLAGLFAAGRLLPPLAALVDLRHWQLTTADSATAMNHMFSRMAEVGFTHVAYISTTGALRQAILEQYWADVEGVSRFYAADAGDAHAWLAGHGFGPADTQTSPLPQIANGGP